MNPFRIFLLAALVLVVFGVQNVSATEDNLLTELSGDHGNNYWDITSYASENGHAYFTGKVSSASGEGEHTNVTVSVSFDEDSPWYADQATISDCSSSGTTGSNNIGDLDIGETLEFCISVSVQESGADIGDEEFMDISVISNEDSTGTSGAARVIVCNWRAYSEDDTKEFEAGTTHPYTMIVKNIKLNEDGEAASFEDSITINLAQNEPAWRFSSDDPNWDPIAQETTIYGMEAGESYELVVNVEVIDIGLLYAFSYNPNNRSISFSANDEVGITQYVTVKAFIHDHFEISTYGIENPNIPVYNGCTESDKGPNEDGYYYLEARWTFSILNFGNTYDSFTITLDTSEADAEGWDVFGSINYVTNTLNPRADGYDGYPVAVAIQVPDYSEVNTVNLTMNVVSNNDESVNMNLEFSVTVVQCFDILIQPHNVNIKRELEEGQQLQFPYYIENKGNGADLVEVYLLDAPAWVFTSKDEVLVPYGVDSREEVTIIANAPSSGAIGEYTFQFQIVSQDGTTTNPAGTFTITVIANTTSDESDDDDENSAVSYSVAFVEDIVHVDVSPEASSQGCNEMVVSNEGQATIDVDVALNGGGVTISPGHVSVTLAPGGKITESICALALINSPEKIVQVSALAEGREMNTQLTPVHVTSNFTVEIFNSANTAEDTTSKEEDYEGDEAGECSDEADNDKDGLFDCDDDTCAGSPACKATDIVEAVPEEGLSSLSFVPALISIGLIARYRRK